MTRDKINTEKKILEAARKVFLKKGKDGARMQEIANEAGINKALLHYYFRSKDKLFIAIFDEALDEFIPRIGSVLNSDMSLFDKIRDFTNHYIEFFIENPLLPLFIFHEIRNNPDRIVKLAGQSGVEPILFAEEISRAVDNGLINPVDPRQLIVNMISLCIFPFVGQPLVEAFLFNNDDEKFADFIEIRKKEVGEFIINSIKK
ncbi:MAG: TetR/AcrR family transcriptional regulator [Bacteroidetes bacterium]|nr:MAG: TetR/AcrR family transcriptional regulator [Bacteroidota bacterium]